MSRRRNYCFTDFELTSKWANLNYSYLTWGVEICPSTGVTHHQGYIELTNGMTISAVKKKVQNNKIHLEARRGSQLDAIRYCHKGEQSKEEWNEFKDAGPNWGLNADIYTDGEPKNQGKRTDITEIMSLIKDENVSQLEIAATYPTQWVIYRKSFESYRQLLQEKRTWKTKVIIIWGQAGVGKTRYAIEQGAEPIEFGGSFIRGYKNQDKIVFDNLEEDDIPFTTLLKMTDRYPYTVNIKGGEMTWNPKELYITSVQNAALWHSHTNEWSRRIDEIIYIDPSGSFLHSKTAQK